MTDATAKEERRFFGRDREKRAIVEAVQSDYRKGRKSWAVLGNRGVGKTEMLRRVAGELMDATGGERQLAILEMHEDPNQMERRFLSAMDRAEEKRQISRDLARELRNLEPRPGEPDTLVTRFTRRAEHLLKAGHGVCLDEFQYAGRENHRLESWGKSLIDDLDNRELSGTLIIAGSHQQKVSDMLGDPGRAMGGRIHGSRKIRIGPLIGRPLFEFAGFNEWLAKPYIFSALHAVSDGSPRKMWELADAVKTDEFTALEGDFSAWLDRLLAYETVESDDKALNFAGRVVKGSGLGRLNDIAWGILQVLREAEGRARSWRHLSDGARRYAESRRKGKYGDDEWQGLFFGEMEILIDRAKLLAPTKREEFWDDDRFCVTSGNLMLHLLAGPGPDHLDAGELSRKFDRGVAGFAFEELIRGHLLHRAEQRANGGFVRSQRGVRISERKDMDAMASAFEAVPRDETHGGGQRLISLHMASCKRSWTGFFQKGNASGEVGPRKDEIFDDFALALSPPSNLLCRRELSYLTEDEKIDRDGALSAKTGRILASVDFGGVPEAQRAELLEKGKVEFLDIPAMAEELGLGTRPAAQS